MINFGAAQAFMADCARPVEQAVFAVLFDQGDPAKVAAELERFRNDDGGFGHGLEPDKLVPASQALDVEIAFERLSAVGLSGHPFIPDACDWLASIADETGAVPVLMPSSNNYPRAAHWSSESYPPGLNPTAAIVGHAHALTSDHPWVSGATEYCFDAIETGATLDMGFELLAVTKLLAHAPDQDRARAASRTMAAAIESAAFVKYDATSDDYGVTPLEFAPTPNSYARPWFPDQIIDQHLQALGDAQMPDGGWPVEWDPPTAASLQAWRGIRTLDAVATARAYESA